jgi:hypothetical protein
MPVFGTKVGCQMLRELIFFSKINLNLISNEVSFMKKYHFAPNGQ